MRKSMGSIPFVNGVVRRTLPVLCFMVMMPVAFVGLLVWLGEAVLCDVSRSVPGLWTCKATGRSLYKHVRKRPAYGTSSGELERSSFIDFWGGRFSSFISVVSRVLSGS